MRSLTEYREMLERLEGGTVPVAFAQEILQAAEDQLQQAQGEHTITRAMELSGKSRGWFMRRLDAWAAQGLARRVEGGPWLVKDAVVPRRRPLASGGVDPSLSDEEIYRQLMAS